MNPRLSPLHDALVALNPRWASIHDMLAAVEIPGEQNSSSLQLADASCLPRMGVKGAQAEAWLQSQNIQAPSGINRWIRTSEGTLIARLARSEFFLEDPASGTTVDGLRGMLKPEAGVSPVLRQEGAIVLFGESTHDLLVQTCNINFRAWKPEDQTVVMTSMAGVSVLVMWEPYRESARYRIWCDHTFAPYLWATLMEIAQELGGGAVGLSSLIPEVTD